MKAPSAAARRLALLGTAIEFRLDRLVIRLPHPRLIRLAARSLLLALALFSLPLLNVSLLRAAGESNEDRLQVLPAVLADLRARGLFRDDDRAIFLGDPGSALPDLIRNGVEPVPVDLAGSNPPVDLAVGAAGLVGFDTIDRVLKAGGVAAIRLGSDPSELFRFPAGYRMVYAKRFGAALVVAVKKTAPTSGSAAELPLAAPLRRRLLSVPEAKMEALKNLEDVALEPPVEGQKQGKTRYLPDLMGDSLSKYPRRVFVDVGAPGRAGSAGWFERHYPKRHGEFEIIRVDAVANTAVAEEKGMTEWLTRNVKEEEYVVVKAEAEVVEEMVRGQVLGLVDELFLGCSNQWHKKGKKSRRAYWECLALYGKLRDEGVAVHQWWGQ